MTTDQATALLDAFRAGRATRDDVLRAFQAAPVADLGFAQVDTHRALRKGFPEVIFGAGKTPAQVTAIAARLVAREQNVLITRITATPPPLPALYGARMGKVYVDALPVRYDHDRWQREFLANWPPGSPAFESYHGRIIHGPAFTIDDANRLHGVRVS